MDLPRCAWCPDDPLYRSYHDDEWGVPLHDERRLFEMLILEGAQAGLSWYTILRKRPAYRLAFEGFEPARVARFGEDKIAALLADPGIVRNQRKVRAAVKNAQVTLEIQSEFGSLDAYLWSFVGGRPLVNRWQHISQIPASTPDSDRLSADLKKRGMSFVGTTIVYSFMQAVGMVNDHEERCYRWEQVQRLDG